MMSKRPAVNGLQRKIPVLGGISHAEGSIHRLRLAVHHVIAALFLAAAMSGCGTMGKREGGAIQGPSTSAPRGGGYYLDDGPGANPPADIDGIPDPVPRVEPLRSGAARPYTVMGKHYIPMTALAPYQAHGLASWYGRRYHGKMTASGEIYDMYGMTAAHPTLPIPSYARVTNLANGRSVVVRINDRGPFVDGRLIDLSYTAAHKLGILGGGRSMVEVASIIPGEPAPTTVASGPVLPQPAAGRDDDRATADRTPAAVATTLPAPEANPPPRQVPLSQDVNGFYLQLGAFGSRENADNYLTKLTLRLDWLAQALHVFRKDGLFKVHAGPYPDSAQAQQVADRISRSLGIKPLVLMR